jgi:hypothetical protein
MIGFLQNKVTRQPIYGIRTAGKVGYTERDSQGREWFQDSNGRRIARVLRYKEYQAACPQVSPNGCTHVPHYEEM